jgi:hypothetical protein
MVNMFKLKKYGSFLTASFLPAIMLLIGMMQFGLFYGFVFFAVGGILGVVLGSFILKHPLLELLEGSGLLILTFDSTGLIKPHIAKVDAPYITSNIKGKPFSTVFDRNAVNYLALPQKAKVETNDENITISLPKEDYHKSHFSFSGTFPCMVYNTVLGEFYTKETLSKFETETFVQHLVLYLNRKVDELSNNIRDFTRYIVEQTKPKTNFLQSKLFWVVVIIVILLLAVAMAPQIMKTLSSVQIPSLPSVPVTPNPTS